MKIGLDVDDTIMRLPAFFSLLSNAARKEGWEIHVVTTRPDRDVDKKRTLGDLSAGRIAYDTIYHLPKQEGEVEDCPHAELSDYEKFVWQKVKYCKENNVNMFFDDDEHVVEMFKRYAPDIQVFRVCKHDISL